MRHEFRFRWKATLVLAVLTAEIANAQIDPDDLRLGLIATYRDTAAPKSAEVVQLDATVAVNLNKDEAPHPRLASAGGTYRWEGYINILRAAEYQFSVSLRGKVCVTVAGKEVLSAESSESKVIDGPTGRLESGFQPIVVEFTRTPGSAQLQLHWKAPFFHKEPVPYQFLKHDPANVPKQLALDRQIERGRFLIEEHSCAKCHEADGLASRQGPELTKIGERVFPGWIYRWLLDPQKVHSAAAMPRMFSADANGEIEAYAVTRYLLALSRPLKTASKTKEQPSARRGEQLFTTTGCAACHVESKKPAESSFIMPGRSFPLGKLTNKTTPAILAAYLQDPLAIDPSGRMPKLPLDAKEIADLSAFLCSGEPDETARQLPAPPGGDRKWLELGRQTLIARRCTSCHQVADDGKLLEKRGASASLGQLRYAKVRETGCVATKQDARSAWFRFKEADVDAIAAFLREETRTRSPAPQHAARATLTRFNCLACHSRDGEGGLSTELTEELRRFEKAEFAEAVNPPPLTGVAGKLQKDWLDAVLTNTARARPWMGLRMPQFGKANVGKLAQELCSLEGVAPQAENPKVALTPAKIEAGRHLVGKSAFGCVSCHDLAGIPASGTRGPDLASMNQRVRYDWYRRWMEQAQRMQPGTRMPTVFPDGLSTVPNILKGHADSQAEAIWAYLSLGPTLPLAEGVGTPKGRVLAAQQRPVIVRTFMPDSGTKSIAIAFPGGVSTVFDAGACRLGYAWSGNFVDIAPAWDGRGGSPAKVLGSKFWMAPSGFPWATNTSNDPPDFVKQRTDTERGAPLPDGKVFTGEHHLFFQGYSTDAKGMPVFRYDFDGTGSKVSVEERPIPLQSAAGTGLAREFKIEAGAKQNAWLFVGEFSTIRWLDRAGKATSVPKERDEVPPNSHVAVVPQGPDRVLLLSVAEGLKDSRWVVRQSDSKVQLFLRLALDQKAIPLTLRMWAPYRDEPALLKEILAEK